MSVIKSRLHLGRSREYDSLFGDPQRCVTRPVEIRGDPWRPVESGLMRLGSIINNIGIVCDHPGDLCGPLCDAISLGAFGADAGSRGEQHRQRGYALKMYYKSA